VATLWLVVQARGARRAVGAMVATGLVAKVALERPFGDLLHTAAGLDIAIAPIAHATGVIAGFACAAAVLAWQQNRGR
jgi:hypothetical protein